MLAKEKNLCWQKHIWQRQECHTWKEQAKAEVALWGSLGSTRATLRQKWAYQKHPLYKILPPLPEVARWGHVFISTQKQSKEATSPLNGSLIQVLNLYRGVLWDTGMDSEQLQDMALRPSNAWTICAIYERLCCILVPSWMLSWKEVGTLRGRASWEILVSLGVMSSMRIMRLQILLYFPLRSPDMRVNGIALSYLFGWCHALPQAQTRASNAGS